MQSYAAGLYEGESSRRYSGVLKRETVIKRKETAPDLLKRNVFFLITDDSTTFTVR